MTKVPEGIWQGKFLAICSTDSPEEIRTPPPFDETVVTDLDVIKRRAVEALDKSGQSQRNPWASTTGQTRAEDPLLVEREDVDPPGFYYIVPFYRGAAEAPILATVDAYEAGGLTNTIASPEGTTHFGNALYREAVIQRFGGQEVEVGGTLVRLEEKDLHDTLVWRPCAESLSLFRPFYRFDVGGPGSENRVYVRIDGELFTELTFGMGM